MNTITPANVIFFNSVDLELPYQIGRSWGVYRVATEVRNQGLTTRVVSFSNQFTTNEIDILLKKIIDESTLIVGFSINFWDWTSNTHITHATKRINAIITYINDNYPHIKIIAGGGSAMHFVDDTLLKVDAIFRGYSENYIVPYVIAIRDKKYIPLPTAFIKDNIALYDGTSPGTFDFNSSQTIYQPEDISYYDVPNIEVGRGCIFKCGFCSFLLNGKKKLDYIKEVEILREELLRNYNDHGIQNYVISDDTFNDSSYKIEILHKLFTSLPFKIKFFAYLRIDLLYAHPEQIPLLKEMGITLAFFGIETFDKKAASTIGKGLDSTKAKQLLYDLKTKHWGHEVKVITSFIVGLPYAEKESYDDLKEWICNPNNFVDHITVMYLKNTNPVTKIDSSTGRAFDYSDFSKNSEKYGFYWPTDDVSDWRNPNGYITSRDEAKEFLMNEIIPLIHKFNKQPNLVQIFTIWAASQQLEIKPSMDDLQKMSTTEFDEWSNKNIYKNKMGSKYIQAYKDKWLK